MHVAGWPTLLILHGITFIGQLGALAFNLTLLQAYLVRKGWCYVLRVAKALAPVAFRT